MAKKYKQNNPQLMIKLDKQMIFFCNFYRTNHLRKKLRVNKKLLIQKNQQKNLIKVRRMKMIRLWRKRVLRKWKSRRKIKLRKIKRV